MTSRSCSHHLCRCVVGIEEMIITEEVGRRYIMITTIDMKESIVLKLVKKRLS